jgi:hypothetical protein
METCPFDREPDRKNSIMEWQLIRHGILRVRLGESLALGAAVVARNQRHNI